MVTKTAILSYLSAEKLLIQFLALEGNLLLVAFAFTPLA
jgi:hypothetical protein